MKNNCCLLSSKCTKTRLAAGRQSRNMRRPLLAPSQNREEHHSWRQLRESYRPFTRGDRRLNCRERSSRRPVTCSVYLRRLWRRSVAAITVGATEVIIMSIKSKLCTLWVMTNSLLTYDVTNGQHHNKPMIGPLITRAALSQGGPRDAQ